MDLRERFSSVRPLLGGVEPVGPIPSRKEMVNRFLHLAWPSVVEAVLIGLVGVADTVMVATLGDTAIAAVGITTQPKFVLLCFSFSVNVGITAVVARRRGEQDREGANHAMRNGLLIGLLITLTAAFLGNMFAEPFLRLAGAKDDFIADAVAYFRIITFSVVFQSLNGLINAAQKGSGHTRISMITNLVGNLVNICFNYLLINGIGIFPRLEVRGAAIATLLGTMSAVAISFSMLLKRSHYLNVFVKAPWGLKGKELKPIFFVSRSALIEQL